MISRKEKPTAYIGTFTLFTLLVSEKRPLRDKSDHYLSDSAYKGEGEVAVSKRTEVKYRIRTSRELIYHEFIDLNQARPTIIGFDNIREINLVAIKRLERIDKPLTHRIRSFISNSMVNIRDIYFDNDDLVIIYEVIYILLRQITGIL
jgi:hypothetical protein